MKINRKSLTWVVAGICAVAGVIWYIMANQPSSPAEQTAKQTDAAVFKAQYPNVAADNLFVIAKPTEVIDIFESGDGVVFLGFPECPWCQQLAPIVDEAAKAERLEKVYYLNIREARANNDETYQNLIKQLEDYLPKDEDGNPRIYVPDVTVVRQGKIIGRFKQEATANGEQATPDTYWTSERRERAITQLREMMSQI